MSKFSSYTALAGAQVPTDLVLIDQMSGPTVKSSTLDALFSDLSKNVTTQPITATKGMRVGGSNAVGDYPLEVRSVAAQTVEMAIFKDSGGTARVLISNAGTFALRGFSVGITVSQATDAKLYFDQNGGAVNNQLQLSKAGGAFLSVVGCASTVAAGQIPKFSALAELAASLLSESGSNLASTGNLLFSTDNTLDIGAAGATRPRTGYFATSLRIGAGSTVGTRLGENLDLHASANYGGMAITTWSAGSEFSIIDIRRSKSNTIGTHGLLANGDVIGRIIFNASDGAAWQTPAYIEAAMDGTTGAGDVPTRLAFYTTPDGSATPAERWRMDNGGNLLASTDNSWDLGASGATRPRTGYFGTSVVAPTLVATSLVNLNAAGDRNIRVGSGTPEGAITASVGSLYLRTDGGAGTTLYVKESGTGNTGWVAK